MPLTTPRLNIAAIENALKYYDVFQSLSEQDCSAALSLIKTWLNQFLNHKEDGILTVFFAALGREQPSHRQACMVHAREWADIPAGVNDKAVLLQLHTKMQLFLQAPPKKRSETVPIAFVEDIENLANLLQAIFVCSNDVSQDAAADSGSQLDFAMLRQSIHEQIKGNPNYAGAETVLCDAWDYILRHAIRFSSVRCDRLRSLPGEIPKDLQYYVDSRIADGLKKVIDEIKTTELEGNSNIQWCIESLKNLIFVVHQLPEADKLKSLMDVSELLRFLASGNTQDARRQLLIDNVSKIFKERQPPEFTQSIVYDLRYQNLPSLQNPDSRRQYIELVLGVQTVYEQLLQRLISAVKKWKRLLPADQPLSLAEKNKALVVIMDVCRQHAPTLSVVKNFFDCCYFNLNTIFAQYHRSYRYIMWVHGRAEGSETGVIESIYEQLSMFMSEIQMPAEEALSLEQYNDDFLVWEIVSIQWACVALLINLDKDSYGFWEVSPRDSTKTSYLLLCDTFLKLHEKIERVKGRYPSREVDDWLADSLKELPRMVMALCINFQVHSLFWCESRGWGQIPSHPLKKFWCIDDVKNSLELAKNKLASMPPPAPMETGDGVEMASFTTSIEENKTLNKLRR